MDPFIIIAVGLLGFVGIALAAIFLEAQRSGKMIRDWADEHGYTVVEKKQPLVNLGPFRWEQPRGRTFYHVTVSDSRGKRYTGWICCGVEWLGLFSNKVEVRWDAGEPPGMSVPLAWDTTVWPPPPVE